MNPRLTAYLNHMKVAALESLRFVEGMSYAEFQDDTKTQRAVTMNLVIVAEARRSDAKKTDVDYRDYVYKRLGTVICGPSFELTPRERDYKFSPLS